MTCSSGCSIPLGNTTNSTKSFVVLKTRRRPHRPVPIASYSPGGIHGASSRRKTSWSWAPLTETRRAPSWLPCRAPRGPAGLAAIVVPTGGKPCCEVPHPRRRIARRSVEGVDVRRVVLKQQVDGHSVTHVLTRTAVLAAARIH